MLSIIKSGGFIGIDGYIVDVEVSISQGLPQFITVGLPDTAVKESRERVKSAISNTGLNFPLKKIVVNLAPADTPKQGTIYDLPVAIGILEGIGLIKNNEISNIAFLGELALDGHLRKIKGVLPIVLALKEKGIKKVILPEENSKEASLVKDIEVYGFKHLKEVIEFLNGALKKEPEKIDINQIFIEDNGYPDFSEIKGQFSVKRALEIAAAGFHNLLMVGSPGSGKSMMAKAFPSILPPLSFEEALETTKIHSVAGVLEDFLVKKRPFIAPHHTTSDVAIIGGGSIPKPGAVSLAHNGVLFLDELPEFKRSVLEVLRQPLEDRIVVISRATGSFKFPAKFQLIAAANPCPCGYKNDPNKECVCSPREIKRYNQKFSGPLLDRIDINVYVNPVSPEDLSSLEKGESSKEIKERVLDAVEIQKKRFKNFPINFNSEMTPSILEKVIKLTPDAENILLNAARKYNLTARSYHRILKVARTIADLNKKEEVESPHIIEALRFKMPENF
ncbi:MAG: YifB family Mg chelatase-like AAA ATPase [Aquificae bacterium]|nr:YifB family Mg chelatase-like AAA ATPase [Aquificota bacterium]